MIQIRIIFGVQSETLFLAQKTVKSSSTYALKLLPGVVKIRFFVESKIDPVFFSFIKNNQLEKYFSLINH